MLSLFLLEEKIPEEVVQKLIGNDYKRLIEIGFDNRELFNKNSWRIIFNPKSNKFNKIEETLTKKRLQLISMVNQLKQSLTNKLKDIEKYYLSLFSLGITIIDKHMGENYTEQTLQKYRIKMKEIYVNYSEKLQILIDFTGEKRETFENIHKDLMERGLLWLEWQAFTGYLDVHQIVVKSFIEIKPVTEIKEKLQKLQKT